MIRELRTLTLGLMLTAAPAVAQTTPAPQTSPTLTSPPPPVTAPTLTAAPTGAPTLGLPAQTAPGVRDSGTPTQALPSAPETPLQTEPPAAAPDLTAPVPPPTPADTVPTDAAPADTVPAVSTSAEAAAIQLPALPGETVLRTVPTVLGEALIYPGTVHDALPRTLTALQAEGYTVVDAGSQSSVHLDHLGQSLTLTVKQQLGLTVLALSGDPKTLLFAPANSSTPDGAPADQVSAPAAPDPSTDTGTPASTSAPVGTPAPADTSGSPGGPAPITIPAPGAPGEPTSPAPVTPDPAVPTPGVPVPTPPPTP